MIELPFEPAAPRRVWPGTRLFGKLCTSEDWIAEPKKDGWRCIVLVSDGAPVLMSRHGKRIRGQGAASAAKCIDVPPDTWLDAELVSGVLWVFDVLRLAGAELAGLELDQRRVELEQLLPALGPVRTMPRVNATKYIEGAKDEGVIFKQRAQPYPMGATNHWIKCRR
jgi:ATP-dependent DNA ligase